MIFPSAATCELAKFTIVCSVSLEGDPNFVDLTIELERPSVEVVVGDDEAEVGTDVEGLAGSEGDGDGTGDVKGQRFTVLDGNLHLGRSAGLSDGGGDLDQVTVGAKRGVTAHLVLLDDHHIVAIHKVALSQVYGDTAPGAAESVEDAVGLFNTFEVHLDHIALTTDAGGGDLGHTAGVRVLVPLSVGRFDSVGGVEAEPVASADGKVLVDLYNKAKHWGSLPTSWAGPSILCLKTKRRST